MLMLLGKLLFYSQDEMVEFISILELMCNAREIKTSTN